MRAPGSMVQKRPMAAGPTIWSMSPIATPSPSQMFSFRRTPGMLSCTSPSRASRLASRNWSRFPMSCQYSSSGTR